MRSTELIILNITLVVVAGRWFRKKCSEKAFATPPNSRIPDMIADNTQLLRESAVGDDITRFSVELMPLSFSFAY